MTKFLNYIENSIQLDEKKLIGAIIGLNPSLGARSPILWNQTFFDLKMEANFFPFDVNELNLQNLVDNLKTYKKFIGGAVAVPYKEKIIEYLDIVEDEAKIIGAVNAIYRNSDNLLVGANTDGLAALQSIRNKAGDLKDKKVLVIGLGGAGKAVASYLVKNVNELYIYNRTIDKVKKYMHLLNEHNLNVETLDSLETISNEFDIVINTTSVGFSPDTTQDKDLESPLSESQVMNLKKDAIVFDIIYQPIETKLLNLSKKHGLITMNGLEMNFLQAALAFKKAFRKTEMDQITNSMSKV